MSHLVLTRAKDQTIIYRVPPSDTETVIQTVVEDIRGGTVRIGSRAPQGVTVDRLEVFESKQREAAAEKLATATAGKGKAK